MELKKKYKKGDKVEARNSDTKGTIAKIKLERCDEKCGKSCCGQKACNGYFSFKTQPDNLLYCGAAFKRIESL